MKGKLTKRFLALLMVMTMIFSMSLVAGAAEKSPQSPNKPTTKPSNPEVDVDITGGKVLASGNVALASDENDTVYLYPVSGEITEADYIAAIDLAIENGLSNITALISAEHMNVISANVFTALKEEGLGINLLIVTGLDMSDKSSIDYNNAYGWMIPEVTNAVAFDPALTVNPENSNAAKLVEGKSIVVDFAQNGAIPGLAQVGVATSSEDVKGIDNPVLYYYNPETKVLEKQDNEVQIGEGETDFILEHCSTYVIADKDAKAVTSVNASNPQTGDSAPIALFAVAMVIALGAAAVVVIRKRKAA